MADDGSPVSAVAVETPLTKSRDRARSLGKLAPVCPPTLSISPNEQRKNEEGGEPRVPMADSAARKNRGKRGASGEGLNEQVAPIELE